MSYVLVGSESMVTVYEWLLRNVPPRTGDEDEYDSWREAFDIVNATLSEPAHVCKVDGHKWAEGFDKPTLYEGMADLHGTTDSEPCLFTAGQIEAAGFVRRQDVVDNRIDVLQQIVDEQGEQITTLRQLINAKWDQAMKEIRKAQYPQYGQIVHIPVERKDIIYTVTDHHDAE